MLLFLENVDIFTLASLSKEYQVDWLTKRIEKYLEENISQITGPYSNSEKVLRYFKLASNMRFHRVTILLLRSLGEPFNILQTSEGFSDLNVRAKIMVARKCLWDFTFEQEIETTSKKSLLDSIEFGLLTVLKEFDQQCLQLDESSGDLFGAKLKSKPYLFREALPPPYRN